MLHEIDELHVYCGPGALIAVTGKRLPEVRAAINKAKGRRENAGVCGTKISEMETALQLLGVPYHFVDTRFTGPRRTLQEWTKLVCIPGKRYIVNVTGHYVTYCDGIVIDNRIRFGCPVEEHPCRRKKVKTFFVISDN